MAAEAHRFISEIYSVSAPSVKMSTGFDSKVMILIRKNVEVNQKSSKMSNCRHCWMQTLLERLEGRSKD